MFPRDWDRAPMYCQRVKEKCLPLYCPWRLWHWVPGMGEMGSVWWGKETYKLKIYHFVHVHTVVFSLPRINASFSWKWCPHLPLMNPIFPIVSPTDLPSCFRGGRWTRPKLNKFCPLDLSDPSRAGGRSKTGQSDSMLGLCWDCQARKLPVVDVQLGWPPGGNQLLGIKSTQRRVLEMKESARKVSFEHLDAFVSENSLSKLRSDVRE